MTRKTISDHANTEDTYRQLTLTDGDFPDDWAPGTDVEVTAKGNAVVITPAEEEMHVPAAEKRHSESVYGITMEFSEFEARVVANRLWEAAESYEQSGRTHAETETKWLSRRFMERCMTRENSEVDA